MFQYKTHLHILQLEEYQLDRFLKWVFGHYFKRKLEGKKPLVWTSKATQIYILAVAFAILLILILSSTLGFLGFLIGLAFVSQSYLFLILGTLIRVPYEKYNRIATKNKTLKKILSLRKLKVIGIAGSYAKTSTKDILYQILSSQYKVLKTPLSYNTLFGISKVVDYELDESHDFFICELGEYKIGEVKELCEMVNPTSGIITGINEQHIERFGTIKNTIKAVFELADYVSNFSTEKDGLIAVNYNNDLIKNNCANLNANFIPYAFNNDKFGIKNISTSVNGSDFTLILDSKEYNAHTNLVGNSHLLNILAASTLAYFHGVNPDNILTVIKSLQPTPHRLELKKLTDENLFIDDSYSSNVNGFKEALELLKQFKDYKKILVTPGIVELGKHSHQIHKEIGNLADTICDVVILIGKTDRTKALEEGISTKNKLIYLDSIKTIWQELKKHDDNKYVVLFENDLPDNY